MSSMQLIHLKQIGDKVSCRLNSGIRMEANIHLNSNRMLNVLISIGHLMVIAGLSAERKLFLENFTNRF